MRLPAAPAALALLAALAVLAVPATAQQRYMDPPAPISRILDAPSTPQVSVAPDRARMLLLQRAGLPSIAELSAPEVRLAGIRLDPRSYARSRGRPWESLAVQPVTGGAVTPISAPAGAELWYAEWGPSSRQVAFVTARDGRLVPWVADAATGAARELAPVRLSAVFGAPCSWMPSGDALLCRALPEPLEAAPAPDAVPAGPAVQESQGKARTNRTYQDLLANPTDEARFAHFATSRLVRIGLDGQVSELAGADLWTSAEPSPDGKWLLTERLHRPFSYVVPWSRFPTTIEVRDASGRVVHVVADLPLRDAVPPDFDAVAVGARNVGWQQGAAATLVWAEALDGGDTRTDAEHRDRVLRLDAPFTGQPGELARLGYRFAGAQWFADGRALVNERWWRTRRVRTWLHEPGKEARVLMDRSSEDRYNDPGSPEMTRTALGWVVETTPDGGAIYLTGQGASAEGDRPFLDRYRLADGQATRLWRSEAPSYETAVALLDAEARRVLTRRESVEDVPNYGVRDLRNDRWTAVTAFTDPAPEFAGLKPELITYERKDGVQLSARLYLPPGYDRAEGPLPMLFWAYPTEFKSAAAASQVDGSPYRFVRPGGSSHLFLLTQGIAILDDPSMPIIGAGESEPNDTYVEQLVASAQAAADKVVAMGVADRNRLAIGGHSYGAFMTANLLAHSDIFRAGLARSGAYNRTLTPFGFQAEERTYWQAPEIYLAMSPFMHADEVNEPILMIHGEADNNSGTYPMQSERMFAALQGNGATVRLVMLPSESHGYAARESVGHVLWEMVEWMRRWVVEQTAGR